MTRAAVFLDRDGTIIRDTQYLARPELVEFLPGAVDAIRRLNQAQVPVVLVTNQSAIARGMMTRDDYKLVHARLVALLADKGAHLDGAYMCPHHPDFGMACECRKPGTQLFRQAAQQRGLDLRRSTYVGDRWRDVEPGITLGGRGILIDGPATPREDRERADVMRVPIVSSLGEAVDRVLGKGAER